MATNYFQFLPSGGGVSFLTLCLGWPHDLFWPITCGFTLWNLRAPKVLASYILDTPVFRQRSLGRKMASKEGLSHPVIPSNLPSWGPTHVMRPPYMTQRWQSHQLTAAAWVSSGKTWGIMRNTKLLSLKPLSFGKTQPFLSFISELLSPTRWEVTMIMITISLFFCDPT